METPNDRTQPVRSGATRQDDLGRDIHLDRDRDNDGIRDDQEFSRDRDNDGIRDDREMAGAHQTTEIRDHDRDVRPMTTGSTTEVVPDRTRGGVSFWSVMSGVVVAFGAFIVLSAIIGAILAATGVAEGGIQASEARDAGLAAGIGLIIAQFLSYLWGGYTAGRMARGSGFLNGLLVPIVALVFVAALAAIIAAVAGDAATDAANQAQSLPLPLSNLGDIGTGVGIGALVAMLLGGLLGGKMGARWHTKLEDGRTRYTD